MKINLEELKRLNPKRNYYDADITDKDVVLLQGYVDLLEKESSTPKIGDMVQFTNECGEFYSSGHLNKINADLCDFYAEAFIPYVFVEKDKTYSFSVSGGYRENANLSELKYVGKKEKYFTLFRSCGSITFPVMVNVWEYNKNKDDFSTKTHDRVVVYEVKNQNNSIYNHKFEVHNKSFCCKTFNTSNNLNRWLEMRKAVKSKLEWNENCLVFWILKEEERYLSKDKYNELSDKELFNSVVFTNGSLRFAKRKYTKDFKLLSFVNMEDKVSGNYKEDEILE